MSAPLDLREFSEWLYIEVCRYPGKFPARADEWALEAIELVGGDNMTDEYYVLVGELEELADCEGEAPNGDLKALGIIEAQLAQLDEIKEKRLERAKKICAMDWPAVVLDDGTKLEFDL